MLIQMLPGQISSQWEILWPAIEASAPPTAGIGYKEMNNILETLLAGEMQAWVSRENNDIVALITTALVVDVGTRIRNLLIYSIYGYKPLTDIFAKDSITTLRKFAAKCGCRRIVAYTDIERVAKIFESVGGKVDSVFLSMPLNGEVEGESIHQG